MCYDSSRGRTVLFGGGLPAFGPGPFSVPPPFGDTWETSSEPNRRVAQVAEFVFSAAGASSPSIHSLTFTAYAGGSGSTTVVPGTGAVVNGATMALWDAWTGAWRALAFNPSGTSAPSVLTYTTSSAAETLRYLADPLVAQMFSLALFPTQGNGSGASPAQVAVDYVELTVVYRQ